MRARKSPLKVPSRAPNAVTFTPEVISPSSTATQKRGVGAVAAVDWRLRLAVSASGKKKKSMVSLQ